MWNYLKIFNLAAPVGRLLCCYVGRVKRAAKCGLKVDGRGVVIRLVVLTAPFGHFFAIKSGE